MPSRELRAEDWQAEIEAGLEYRKKFGLEEKWGQMEAIYYNVHESMANDGPNIFLSQGDAMMSMLTVPSPRVTVKPRIPEAVSKAPLVEALDNTLLEELQVVREVEVANLHAYLWGRGIVKVGYDSEWGYDPSRDFGGDLQLGFTLTQLDKKGKRFIEYDANVIPGMPWVKAVMPHDIIVPWGIRDLENTPWIIHRVCRHIDDLRADVKYENTRSLEPQISIEDFVNSYRTPGRPMKLMNSRNRDATHVEFFEIHERATGKIKAVTWGGDKFLRNQENGLQIDNQLPFAGISFTPRSRSFWTTPDAFYLLAMQMEITDVAVQRTKQRRLAVLKFLYDKNVIGEEELQKLLSVEVGAAAAIESGQDITKAIIKMENTPNVSMVAEEELLRQNAREQVGFSRNQLGEFSGGRKTATEAGIVQRAATLRMSRRGLQAKRLYEDIIKLFNGIVFTYWKTPRLVRVLGGENAERWERMSGAELKSRYSYKVDLVDAEEVRAEELAALQMYGFLAQDPGVDPIELRAYLINRFNNPSFTRIFNPDVRGEIVKREAQGVKPQSNGQLRPPQPQPRQRSAPEGAFV